jgi:hypothetical protein
MANLPTTTSIKPDPEKALEENDPMEYICQGMAERGYDSLWTARPPSGSAHQTALGEEEKIEYLRQLAVSGRHSYAAAVTGVSRSLINMNQRGDPIFAEAIKEAKCYFRDLLKQEMYRRGVEGFHEEVLGGKNRNQIFKVKKYSDKMLELLAKIHMPEMQKAAAVQVNVENNTTNVTEATFNFKNLDADSLAMARKLLESQIPKDDDSPKVIEGEVVPDA